jgi:polyphosphate kinase
MSTDKHLHKHKHAAHARTPAPTARFRATATSAPAAVEHAVPARERYAHRELSWLAFNRRVLEEAQDGAKPLLERLKFLAIVSSNLDEFVMVRAAELHAQAHGRESGGDEALILAARSLFNEVRSGVRRLVEDQYRCWREQVAPALAAQGVVLVGPDAWQPVERESLRTHFRNQLEPVLTPLGVDPTKPFPVVANRGLNVAVQLEPEGGGQARTALVAVPGGARLVALGAAPGRFALVEDVVLTFLDSLFPGYRILARSLFRATRDGALEIDEDQATDMLSEIEQELSSRDRSHVVRLEVPAAGDVGLRAWLAAAMDLDVSEIEGVDGPLDLTVFFALGDRVERADLRDVPFTATLHPGEWDDPFTRIRSAETLIHHPFQSFQRIVELVEKAAADERVLAIKQTLYRVSGNSPIARALVRAAKAGKQVTVLIELMARFDEATNIRWAKALQEAGAHVVYGLAGLKVHAKLLMIIRKDEDGLRRYVHLGTGNYNDKTARLYTDLSYLTCNEAVGRDVAALFNMLTGYSQPPEWERLAVAPLTLRARMVEWIRREAAHARLGKGGRIIAKFNSLVDDGLCDELYAASQAGVEIDLIVRGMCILRPGVPGLSGTIRVRSLVGRLLEHSRIYYFANQGAPVIGISSADWMTRNLDRRVEYFVAIEDEALRERLMTILDICLEDNVQARVLEADGTYRRLRPKPGEAPRAAFARLLEEGAHAIDAPPGEEPRTGPRFKPRRKQE